ncbi:MAG: aminoacyl-histidine dipeptidase [Peptostreptococcaceae bacterium]|nr:aminoacyl-histidine dipeptidase [Peptostreptococcaceae bacterium]
MENLNNLKPEKVFKYFKEIVAIPHCSKNEKQLSNYIVDFAKERGIKYIQDDAFNVILFKDATAGYEKAEPIILQGHMDMVCEKVSGSCHDFAKDGLDIYVDGDFLKAKDTTLGGDNGIAVAMILALFDSDDVEHPRIEAIITTDEETGLFGAESIDVSMLKGKKLINIDSEEEGIFTVSCAGGITAIGNLPVSRKEVSGIKATLKVGGLLGGHSGMEIDKERANASKLIARVLTSLGEDFKFVINTLEGGSADNVITKEAVSELILLEDDYDDFSLAVSKLNDKIRHEYKAVDKNINIAVINQGKDTVNALSKIDSYRAISYVNLYPQGIQNMSKEIEGLIETSLNLGVIKLEESEFKTVSAIRSAVQTRSDYVAETLVNLTAVMGGKMEFDGGYPGWEYMADSKLRETMIAVYKKMYSKEPEIMAIHAGLECGFFAQKIKDVDCISIGPWIYDVHTPDEKLSISSTKNTYEFLLEVLKAFK